ncbi:hypothetical protein CSKR_200292 [Clonorchis sinensis]|uniref:Uncharacterized protein n=1 Tax=Clonorchis sinensis TaxID=79923 RepID=A0A8T1M0Q5_CLOSI|nr:hypothetical protein CSKR_200292 [Clonorchis sinensis]
MLTPSKLAAVSNSMSQIKSTQTTSNRSAIITLRPAPTAVQTEETKPTTQSTREGKCNPRRQTDRQTFRHTTEHSLIHRQHTRNFERPPAHQFSPIQLMSGCMSSAPHFTHNNATNTSGKKTHPPNKPLPVSI